VTAAAAILSAATALVGCATRPAPGGEEVSEASSALTQPQRGVVKDKDGNPVARAIVEVRAPGGRRELARAITASDGGFVLRVRPGTYDILVTPRGGFAPQLFPAQSITGSGKLELVTITFQAIQATGRILDSQGQPIVGIGVCLSELCTHTDDTGAFSVAANVGETLSINGQISATTEIDIGRPIDPQSNGQDIVLPTVTVTGHVLDASGAPFTGQLGSSPYSYPVSFDGFQGGARLVFLPNDGGAFQFEALPGNIPVLVVDRYLFTVPVQGDTDVTLQIPAPVSLSGRLVDRDGNGLTSQSVCLSNRNCAFKQCPLQSCGTTDADGNYEVEALPGDYEFDSFATAGGPPVITGLLTLSQSTVIDLAIPNRRVTGQVLDPGGAPVAGASVSLQACSSVTLDGGFQAFDCGATVTDGAGHFQVNATAPGSGVLFASAGALSASVPVTISDDVDGVVITLVAPPAPDLVSGQLVDDAGAGVPGQRICYFNTGNDACATTDADGRYDLTLPPGDYFTELLISSPTTPFDLLDIDVTRTVPSDPVLIQIPATRWLSGRVLGPDAAPVAGATVLSQLSDSGNSGVSAFIGSQLTDATGRFTVPVLVGFTYSMQVLPPTTSTLQPFSINNVAIEGDLSLTVALQSTAAGAGHHHAHP
jgi:hypothetical protein